MNPLKLSLLTTAALATLAVASTAHARGSELRVQVVLDGGRPGLAVEYGPPPPPPVVIVQQPPQPVYVPPPPVYYEPEPVYYPAPQPEVVYVPSPPEVVYVPGPREVVVVERPSHVVHRHVAPRRTKVVHRHYDQRPTRVVTHRVASGRSYDIRGGGGKHKNKHWKKRGRGHR